MAGRVLLIRNGETEWNLGGKHASKTETHLTKKGEQDVAFVGHELIGEKKLIDPKTVLRVYVSVFFRWRVDGFYHASIHKCRHMRWLTYYVTASYCSPSERCLKTVELLRIGVHSHQTFRHREGCTEMTSPEILTSPDHDSKVIDVTPWLREWDYGEYEGLTMAQIHELRKNQGLDKTWNIWDEGCPGGECVFLFQLVPWLGIRHHTYLHSHTLSFDQLEKLSC